MKFFVLIALLILGLANAATFRSKTCFFDGQSQCAGYNWQKIGRTNKDQEHQIVFAVKHKEGVEAQCDSLINQLSDPRSSKYGQHLSLEEVGLMFTDPIRVQTVQNYLFKNEIFDVISSPNGEFMTATATIGKWEELLGAEFFDFSSPTFEQVQLRRTYAYTIPEEISESVDFLSNTISFPQTKPNFMIGGLTEARANGNTNPALISSYYNVTSNTVASKKSTQSLFEGLGQSFSPSDLSTFQNEFNIPTQKVANIIGPNNPGSCSSNPNSCAEANLDVQYIMAVAQGAPTTYWSIANSQDMFVDWIVAVASASNPPLVHSMSYGSIAQEDPKTDMTRFSTEACKLGLRGITVIVASGDDGVANFQARSDRSQCGFHPSFPATVPYVTAVGATQGPEFGSQEVACASNTGGLITTGGGFSDFFDRPAYQSTVVSNYLQNGPNLPPTSMFNTKGRGYPDVSLIGHNYEVVIAGGTYQVSGTSASTPSFAGLVVLANSQRIAQGKSSLGFLNPALYQLSSNAFHDITVGENNCCAGQPGSAVCCQYGFNATTGWDPLTGLGSINYKNFGPALVKL